MSAEDSDKIGAAEGLFIRKELFGNPGEIANHLIQQPSIIIPVGFRKPINDYLSLNQQIGCHFSMFFTTDDGQGHQTIFLEDFLVANRCDGDLILDTSGTFSGFGLQCSHERNKRTCLAGVPSGRYNPTLPLRDALEVVKSLAPWMYFMGEGSRKYLVQCPYVEVVYQSKERRYLPCWDTLIVMQNRKVYLAGLCLGTYQSAAFNAASLLLEKTWKSTLHSSNEISKLRGYK
jgi:hypothetical protein